MKKKKRHTFKTQVVVDEKTVRVIYTAFSNRKYHDLRLFKESETRTHPEIKTIIDTGYQGLRKPFNLLSERAANEKVIGMIKRLKIS